MIRLFALLLCGLSAGCTFDVRPGSGSGTDDEPVSEPAVMIDAELFYPERIALPGESRLLVAVDAVDATGRTSLTRFSTALDGRQVPIPLRFSVQLQGGDRVVHELSAAVIAGNRLLRLTGPVLVEPVDADARIGDIRLHPPLEAGFGQAWECGSETVLLGAIDTGVYLAADDVLHAVERVPAASGARYRSLEDSTLGIHEKGGQILLLRGDDEATDCRRLEPLDVPLSGGGNEPGWHIEVGEDAIELTSDYGQTVTQAALINSDASGLATHFRGSGDNGPILATFRRKICKDSATGMPHPHTLEVQYEDGTLSGCGGRPQDLLVDRDWRVTRLGDDAVPEQGGDEREIKVTIRFDAEGRVSGHAACNQYTAGYALSGEGLSVDAPASTKMACAEPRMSLESRFLELLAAVERFDIDRDGALVLIGSSGKITALAREL